MVESLNIHIPFHFLTSQNIHFVLELKTQDKKVPWFLSSGTPTMNAPKHKAIWWAWVNVREPMTKDDFIKLYIAYLDRKHKKVVGNNKKT